MRDNLGASGKSNRVFATLTSTKEGHHPSTLDFSDQMAKRVVWCRTRLLNPDVLEVI